MGPGRVSLPVFEDAWEEHREQMYSPALEAVQEEEVDEAPPAKAGAQSLLPLCPCCCPRNHHAYICCNHGKGGLENTRFTREYMCNDTRHAPGQLLLCITPLLIF